MFKLNIKYLKVIYASWLTILLIETLLIFILNINSIYIALMLSVIVTIAVSNIIDTEENKIKLANEKDDNTMFFISHKLIAILYTSSLMTMLFSFKYSLSFVGWFSSFAISTILIYFIIKRSEYFDNSQPMLVFNAYGIITIKYTFVIGFKKIKTMKTKYLFIPWSAIDNIDFLKRGGKKIILHAGFALWSVTLPKNNNYSNSKYSKWHLIRPDANIIIPLYAIGRSNFIDIENMIEFYKNKKIYVHGDFLLQSERDQAKKIKDNLTVLQK
jgi:hypothetical protein